VDLRCTVRSLRAGMDSGSLPGSRQHRGDCVLVEGEGVAIVDRSRWPLNIELV
jgi:hypothetical protein